MPQLLKLTRTLLCLMLLGAGLSRAHCQADQGAITGLVTDASGAAIPNAQVTLTNTETGLVLHVTTDASGNYVFSPIKIGSYKVEGSAPGFSSTLQENITLHVQDRVEANLSLKTGGEDTVVTVTTAPALLQTEEGSTGQVIEAKTINDTPLNGRNWIFIAQLTAGVAPSNGARGQKGGDFNANGQRAEQNNYIMDGVDNNVNVVDFFNGASYVVRPPLRTHSPSSRCRPDAYSSEFGHSAGAVINASIKSRNEQHPRLTCGSTSATMHSTSANTSRVRVADCQVSPEPVRCHPGSSPSSRTNSSSSATWKPDRIVFGRNPAPASQVPTAQGCASGDFSELLNTTLVAGPPIRPVRRSRDRSLFPTPQLTTALTASHRQQARSPAGRYARSGRAQASQPIPHSLTSGPSGRPSATTPRQTNTLDNTFQWDVRADYNISSKDQALRPLTATTTSHPRIPLALGTHPRWWRLRRYRPARLPRRKLCRQRNPHLHAKSDQRVPLRLQLRSLRGAA